MQINLHFRLFGHVKKSPTPNYGWRKQYNVFFIQIDASTLADFEISEFEISRFDCTVRFYWICLMGNECVTHSFDRVYSVAPPVYDLYFPSPPDWENKDPTQVIQKVNSVQRMCSWLHPTYIQYISNLHINNQHKYIYKSNI